MGAPYTREGPEGPLQGGDSDPLKILSPPPLWGLESLLGLKDRASISAWVDATKQTDRQNPMFKPSPRRGSPR